MKHSRSVKILSYFFCTIYLAALSGAQALVLCIDDHAHGEVKSAYDNCCVNSQAGEDVYRPAIESLRELRGAQCYGCENIGMSDMLRSDVTNSDVTSNILLQTTSTLPYYASILPDRNSIHASWPHTKIPISHFPALLGITVLLL